MLVSPPRTYLCNLNRWAMSRSLALSIFSKYIQTFGPELVYLFFLVNKALPPGAQWWTQSGVLAGSEAACCSTFFYPGNSRIPDPAMHITRFMSYVSWIRIWANTSPRVGLRPRLDIRNGQGGCVTRQAHRILGRERGEIHNTHW